MTATPVGASYVTMMIEVYSPWFYVQLNGTCRFPFAFLAVYFLTSQ